jgi:nucleoside-diphosphate-sugar epimerase
MMATKKKQRILVTGASGTVGKEVVYQLLEEPDKYDVSVFDLNTKSSARFFGQVKSNIKVYFGDLGNEDAVVQACKEKDAVIHLAAIIPPLADDNHALAEKVNVRGTRNLINGIQKYSPSAFLLYSSSISVYGDRLQNPWIKAGDPLVPCERDYYAKTKLKAEKLIRENVAYWTIFRLTAIMGTKNHGVSPLMFHMPLETKMEICTPADTARAFVSALRHQKELEQGIYNLSGGLDCRITYRDFIRRSFEISGMGKPDFASKSFAEKNFHCGYYADGDTLEEILHFRRDSIEDYFDQLKQSIPSLQKGVTMLFRHLIKKRLQKFSEPYQALKNNTKPDIAYFFKNTIQY